MLSPSRKVEAGDVITIDKASGRISKLGVPEKVANRMLVESKLRKWHPAYMPKDKKK